MTTATSLKRHTLSPGVRAGSLEFSYQGCCRMVQFPSQSPEPQQALPVSIGQRLLPAPPTPDQCKPWVLMEMWVEEPSMGAIWETADSAVASKCQPTKDNWFPPCLLGQQGAQPIIHKDPPQDTGNPSVPTVPWDRQHCQASRIRNQSSPNQLSGDLFLRFFSLNHIHRALSSEICAVSQGKRNSEESWLHTGQKRCCS